MIEFDGVSKIYGNGVVGLNNVNLQIQQGEFVAIIGLSGAGKSTLIRTINRMIDHTNGTLTVDGIDVATLKGASLRKFRRKIGMIFQSFNLVMRSSVIKNVLASQVPDMNPLLSFFGIFSKQQKLQALSALDSVGILDKAYTRCDELSGGQQQRVALARTLNQNPNIILADEPVAALDPVTAHQVMDDFKRINQERNISILLNIHHVDLALEYADRVIIVDSVSKRHSACGARIGLLLSKNEEFMKNAMKIAQGRLCSSTVDQVGAAALFRLPKSYYDEVKKEYCGRRDVVYEELMKIPGVVCQKPGGAFYMTAKLPVDSVEDFLLFLLEEFEDNGETVMFAPAEGFYATPGLGKDEMRIAYVLNQDNMRRGVELIRLGLEAYNKKKGK